MCIEPVSEIIPPIEKLRTFILVSKWSICSISARIFSLDRNYPICSGPKLIINFAYIFSWAHSVWHDALGADSDGHDCVRNCSGQVLKQFRACPRLYPLMSTLSMFGQLALVVKLD